MNILKKIMVICFFASPFVANAAAGKIVTCSDAYNKVTKANGNYLYNLGHGSFEKMDKSDIEVEFVTETTRENHGCVTNNGGTFVQTYRVYVEKVYFSEAQFDFTVEATDAPDQTQLICVEQALLIPAPGECLSTTYQ